MQLCWVNLYSNFFYKMKFTNVHKIYADKLFSHNSRNYSFRYILVLRFTQGCDIKEGKFFFVLTLVSILWQSKVLVLVLCMLWLYTVYKSNLTLFFYLTLHLERQYNIKSDTLCQRSTKFWQKVCTTTDCLFSLFNFLFYIESRCIFFICSSELLECIILFIILTEKRNVNINV